MKDATNVPMLVVDPWKCEDCGCDFEPTQNTQCPSCLGSHTKSVKDVMTKEQFDTTVQKLVEAGELDCVCPFSNVPVEMDAACSEMEYEHCVKCEWFGFEYNYKEKP